MEPYDTLLRLQLLDTRLDQLAHAGATLPERSQLAEAQSHVAAVRGELDALRARTAEIDTLVASLEAEGDEITRHHTRLEAQMKTVIAPREAEALQHEMATLSAQHEELDDQGLTLLEEQVVTDERIETLAADLAEAHLAVDARQAAVAAAQGALDEQVGQARIEREAVVASVPVDVLAEYERVRNARGGVAIARLEGLRCGGCHLDLSVAEAEAVRGHAGPGAPDCPNCGRMLVG